MSVAKATGVVRARKRRPAVEAHLVAQSLQKARYLPDRLARHRIKITFAVFVLVVAVQMALGWKPEDPLNLFDREVIIGSIAIVLGLFIRSWAAGTLVKKKRLASDGPYSLVRHPLYLGSTLMMIGFTLLTGMWWNVLVALATAFISFGHAIRDEEAFLAARFSDRWDAYAAQTGRVLPWRIAGRVLAPWDWRRWWRNREYNACLGAALGWLGLVWWG